MASVACAIMQSGTKLSLILLREETTAMTPKDWIVYIDEKNETQAVLALGINGYLQKDFLEAEGSKVIGYVSSGTQKDAIAYGDQVLR
jgi:hypothetical protein